MLLNVKSLCTFKTPKTQFHVTGFWSKMSNLIVFFWTKPQFYVAKFVVFRWNSNPSLQSLHWTGDSYCGCLLWAGHWTDAQVIISATLELNAPPGVLHEESVTHRCRAWLPRWHYLTATSVKGSLGAVFFLPSGALAHFICRSFFCIKWWHESDCVHAANIQQIQTPLLAFRSQPF